MRKEQGPGRGPGHRRGWVGVLGVLLAAAAAGCSEKPVLGPDVKAPERLPDPPAGAVVLRCTVSMPSGAMTCADPDLPRLPAGASADRIIGAQDVYVKLTSTETSWDAGAEVLSTRVTVQNLTPQLLGTPDGVAVSGVRVFFYIEPVAVTGAGPVTVLNVDGTSTFLGTEQPFFQYAGILRPLEISEARTWYFQVGPDVETFSFSVYVAAPMIDEDAVLLGSVWTGLQSNEWGDPANWLDGALPDATTSISVLPAALAEGPNLPLANGDIEAQHLRVGSGSSLDLGGFRATVSGNVDAPGGIANGVVHMTGDGLLGGTVPGLEIDGGVALQRPTTTTGPVSVRGGAIAVRNEPLTIRVP